MPNGIDNIFRVLNAADETDVAEGKVAYSRYNAVCGRIAKQYKLPFLQVVAVFVALSPNNDYFGNLRSTLSVLDGFKRGVALDEIRVSTYNHCRNRAFSYLNGTDFLATAAGDKIRAFYLNIINPLNDFDVTIDGHAANIWNGERVPLKDLAARMNKKQYKVIADDFRTVARRVGLLPNQVQSITWFAWKRQHNILFKPRQRRMFLDNSTDFWETEIALEFATPFETIKPGELSIHAARTAARERPADAPEQLTFEFLGNGLFLMTENQTKGK